ncbi:putative citrate synthase [Helianthus annuus]|nr:putative citrate synthase [Helianthus annuus]
MAGRPPVLPSSNLSYSENFLYMLDSIGDKSYKPNPRLARLLDILFILHAEHEMNCSTSAARHPENTFLSPLLLDTFPNI